MLKRYIWLAYILLVTLAVALATDLLTAYINAEQGIPLATKPTSPQQVRGRQAGAAFANYRVIVKRNIFNSNPPREVQPPRVVQQVVQATPLRLELVGTANDADDQRYAIIADLSQRGTQAVYLTGDVIQNALIVDVRRDCVVLDRSGQHESFCIEHETPDTKVAGRQPPSPPTSPFPAEDHPGIVRVDATTWRVSRALFLEPFGSLEALSAQAKLRPYRVVQGLSQGIILTRLRPGSLLRKIGIQNHDVLQKVNGLSLTTSPHEAPQAFQNFQNESNIKLTILRRNRAITLTYELR
jgi:general secretion pathway protein C